MILLLLIACVASRALAASQVNFASFAQGFQHALDDGAISPSLLRHIQSLEGRAGSAPYMADQPIPAFRSTLLANITQAEWQARYNMFEDCYRINTPDVIQPLCDMIRSYEAKYAPEVMVPDPLDLKGLPFGYYANNTPAAVRLALVPRGMVVSWQNMASYSAPPKVLYGKTETSLTLAATGSQHTYGTVYFNDVVLSGLDPSSRYFFQIVDNPALPLSAHNYELSSTWNFTTAPTKGEVKPFTITVVGDMGTVNANGTSAAVAALVPETDFVLHIGDISYADDFFMRPGQPGDDTYESTWNSWQVWQQPVTAAIPYMVLPGNHEVTCQEVLGHIACPERQNNFTAYRHRFRMPSVESGAGSVQNMWHSYDYGLAHFINLNTESDYPNSPEGPGTRLGGGPFGGPGTPNPSQLAWLEKDLQAANASRSVTPWIIVSGHRPIYSSIGSEADAAMYQAFENLFVRFRVDFYFCGHIHYYERLFPIAAHVAQPFTGNTYTNPKAPVYIINGSAGNVEGLHQGTINKNISAFLNINDYGYGRLTVFNATHSHWGYYKAQDRALNDELWVVHS